MKVTLDEKTLWKLIIKLQKVGYKDVDATARIRFVQERNYEPPSGIILFVTVLLSLHECSS